MATTTTNALSISTPSSLLDARQLPSASSQRVSLPPLPLQSQIRLSKTTTYSRNLARNVVAMAATGETPTTTTPIATSTTETPEADPSEILKPIQEAWDKVEDKYAVSSLAVAGFIGLWGSLGLVSAIDRLPLVPGVLELVGIGYTGWFAYKNLITKTDRDALIEKINNAYKDITGSG